MWCFQCKSETTSEFDSVDHRLRCAKCRSELKGTSTSHSSSGEATIRNARAILQKWSASDLLDQIASLGTIPDLPEPAEPVPSRNPPQAAEKPVPPAAAPAPAAATAELVAHTADTRSPAAANHAKSETFPESQDHSPAADTSASDDSASDNPASDSTVQPVIDRTVTSPDASAVTARIPLAAPSVSADDDTSRESELSADESQPAAVTDEAVESDESATAKLHPDFESFAAEFLDCQTEQVEAEHTQAEHTQAGQPQASQLGGRPTASDQTVDVDTDAEVAQQTGSEELLISDEPVDEPDPVWVELRIPPAEAESEHHAPPHSEATAPLPSADLGDAAAQSESDKPATAGRIVRRRIPARKPQSRPVQQRRRSGPVRLPLPKVLKYTPLARISEQSAESGSPKPHPHLTRDVSRGQSVEQSGPAQAVADTESELSSDSHRADSIPQTDIDFYSETTSVPSGSMEGIPTVKRHYRVDPAVKPAVTDDPSQSTAADSATPAVDSSTAAEAAKPQVRRRIDSAQPLSEISESSHQRTRTQTRPQRRYIDEAHAAGGVRGPHFEVTPPKRSNFTSLTGQMLAYLGVLGLTVGTAMVIYGHFGGYSEYTPTGWLVTTVAQMLLFLGVINLVSGGIEQNNHDVSHRINSLSEQLLRMQESTEQALRGPKVSPSRYADPSTAEESSREEAVTTQERLR